MFKHPFLLKLNWILHRFTKITNISNILLDTSSFPHFIFIVFTLLLLLYFPPLIVPSFTFVFTPYTHPFEAVTCPTFETVVRHEFNLFEALV